jgi:hypothetical protein
MEKTFYSNGKLLITGEYLVLDGAKSLALPTKFGQFLKVKSDLIRSKDFLFSTLHLCSPSIFSSHLLQNFTLHFLHLMHQTLKSIKWIH